ncbi:hypothetical protein H2200_006636 [Cladophialophora chaetospira]|uniref:CENP-V/GFA domain-containing protein n=1 Tax=Cladophialophora chaetospira TaxID=386627 RepID=A0AA39CHV7_9EURO|nr:hypothetical protein H2200_006636 [Cladophialophora chaetospira]
MFPTIVIDGHRRTPSDTLNTGEMDLYDWVGYNAFDEPNKQLHATHEQRARLQVVLCHCTNCKRYTSSAFSTNIGVPRSSYKITQGDAKVFVDKGTTGKDVIRTFCGDCGSAFTSEPQATPDVVYVKYGTLDDRGLFDSVGGEIWCRSKESWLGEGIFKDQHDALQRLETT